MVKPCVPRNEASVANGEGPVFLEAFVAKKLRPHQRDGVRFMPLGFPFAGRGSAWKVGLHKTNWQTCAFQMFVTNQPSLGYLGCKC